jgi:hypothetical protein
LTSDATVAVKYSGKLRKYYLRLKRRVGHERAIVATAHKLLRIKLLRIIYHMFKEDNPCEERDDDLLYRKLKKMGLKAKELKSERLERVERKGREILITLTPPFCA